MTKTKLIVIEGTDGSGKETQTKLVTESLSKMYKVKSVSYPNYESYTSDLVKHYLAGDFGTAEKGLNPYQASTLFAVDRLASYEDKLNGWKKDYLSGEYDFIICDRYVTSNMLYQGSKFDFKNDIKSFINWNKKFEYKRLCLPEPNLVLFLDMPIWASQILRRNRPCKATGSSTQDIHESDTAYLEKVYRNSKYICELNNWVSIPCIDKNDEIYSKENICKMILINITLSLRVDTEAITVLDSTCASEACLEVINSDGVPDEFKE